VGPVGVATVSNSEDVDVVVVLVNGVYRSMFATAGASQVVQRRVKLLAEAVRGFQNGEGVLDWYPSDAADDLARSAAAPRTRRIDASITSAASPRSG
jgi:hypothetical protein